MLAPRNQTSGFCRSNIELGEQGSLFLSNYMKLQQLSHSFWQRLYVHKTGKLGARLPGAFSTPGLNLALHADRVEISALSAIQNSIKIKRAIK
jgi:hypothetical protein